MHKKICINTKLIIEIKALSHYNELAQRTGKFWENLAFAGIR